MDSFRRTSSRSSDRLLSLLCTPKVGNDANATSVHVHHGWLLVLGVHQLLSSHGLPHPARNPYRVRHVFVQVFDHELLCLLFHVCTDETKKRGVSHGRDDRLLPLPVQIEVWSAIEVELALEHLVDSISRSAIARDSGFWDLALGIVAGRVRNSVRDGVPGVDAMYMRLLLQLLEELVWVDLTDAV